MSGGEGLPLPTPLRELFDRALALEGAARERFLDNLAANGDGRVARLRAMLRGGNDPSPLDSSPWHLATESGPRGAVSLPERLGPYRILSELGRGGMGRVFLAEQEGEGFRRTVALKVIAEEGLVDDEIERRFASERAILARLEHPGIARFYDAGRAADGRWYLALEYVAGANLIEHADAQRLSVPERVRLFLAVLDAVACAHARGVVHRDLKPANVLVGADGRPRLLDFGIAKLFARPAKALDAEDLAVTTTVAGARALTPAYASPEQFRGEPVTPASDVFSLGVLLYELLAGERPWNAASASPLDLERAVLGSDPPPPGSLPRRTQRSEPFSASTATATEGARAPRAGRSARDLDAICLHALRKSPAARYPSAAEFARDLERYLDGAPVTARASERRYRIARLLRRNATFFVVAAGLTAAFVAGALWLPSRGLPSEPPPRPFPYSSVSAGDATELEARFATEPASLETGAHLAISLAKGGRLAEARLLLPRLRQIPGRSEDPLVDYVEGTLAVGADEPQRALVLFGTALSRALASGRGELVSQIRAARGRLLSTLGRGDEARADMTAAIAGFESSRDAPSLARVLNDLAVEELQRGRLREGEAILERALAASRDANPGGNGGGVMLGNLAGIAMLRGRPDEAAPRCRESIRIFRANGSHRLAWALTDCSEIVRDLGLTAEADAALAEALSLLAASPAESDFAIALGHRGERELQAGEPERARATAGEIERAAAAGGDRPSLARADRLRAGLAAQQGDLASARRLLDEARTLDAGSGQEDAAAATDLLAVRIELDFGELDAARLLLERIAAASAGEVDSSRTAFLAEILRAELNLRSGRADEAEERLAPLGDADRLPSLERRLALLAARAHLAAGAGRSDAARRDLDRARREAEAANLRVLALERRLDLARLEESAAVAPVTGEGRPVPMRSRERQRVIDEAERLGLLQLARRAAAD